MSFAASGGGEWQVSSTIAKLIRSSRIHVKQDVQPYVCISQDCSKNLQFFADAESWIDHMRRTHTSMWIRHLHNEVIWKCPLPHAQSMPQEYSTEDDLFSRHMTIEHADVSERKLHLLASSGAIPVPRAVDICPICGDTHIPVKRSKAHIQQEGVNSDSNSDSEESEEASKVIEVRRTPKVQFVLTPDPLEDAAAERPVMHKAPLPWDVQDHRRIEKYISKHLKALALYFTRYLLASKEDAGDAARARSLDDAFSNSLSDFIDPPPRPVESPWPTPFFHNEEAESISRQLIEHDIDPSWTVREKLHQWTDPPLEPSREQEWGFSKNTSLPPYEGHQGDSLLRPFVKRYQANQNSSSAVLSFHDFEVAMAKLFVPNESGQPSFVNSDFDEMRRLLGQVGMTEWSRRPRTYAVLNMIGRLEIFDDFISDGLADIALPYTSTQLPGYLTPGAGNRFLEMQYLVLNEAFDLELFPERLIHFIESAEVHFDFIKRLGRGHSGKVDHVMSKLSLKEYARKRMRRRILNYVRALEQLNNEISILKKLSHRHLVKFLGSYTDPSYVGLLMSPVAECDLKDFLDRYPSLEGDREPIRGFFGCLCSAVLYLHHSNIRHRGLKTSNILVYEGRVLITNLEEAHDWNDDELRSRTTLMTDPFEHIYAAPEVFNAESRNSSSDIWSLGCVYMEMMTVLRGETFTSQSIFFEENGDRRPIFYSPLAINDWLTHLQSDEDPEPLKWIRQMLQSVPQNRVTSSQLMAQIHNFNDPVYYDSCCGEKDDRKDT
ncbi:kinase-like domain-containing protein [Rhexocercosporidium sp. MPI-PUGE-AT-0058]|nr:kinase-like domain-containing protein [Rhexocercosporidium sp. MPI-PUGE-AT-0058]